MEKTPIWSMRVKSFLMAQRDAITIRSFGAKNDWNASFRIEHNWIEPKRDWNSRVNDPNEKQLQPSLEKYRWYSNEPREAITNWQPIAIRVL